MSTLPTLYEYYTQSGISSGLSVNQPEFLLNNKSITIFSGSIHYFRVPQAYWSDRLRKLRAAGFNTVATYVPWNLHEPQPGIYEFGNGGTDFQEFLDVEKFLKLAQEEDLFVILRPGPYICAEWDFGGLPSWLLRQKGIQLRTVDQKFMNPVKRYFSVLLTMLASFQFTKGGPIIGFQVENEYPHDYIREPSQSMEYLLQLQNIFLNNGIVELLFISNHLFDENTWKFPGILNTGNFQSSAEKNLKLLQQNQPTKPLLVMEYWSGWFDLWMQNHESNYRNKHFCKDLIDIVKTKASVNVYMFHGGTNFGFLNGAGYYSNIFMPVTSSYDYFAPLNEAGDYTAKYFTAMAFLLYFEKLKLKRPKRPSRTTRVAYPSVKIISELRIADILKAETHFVRSNNGVISMECLPINNGSGQSFGYIVYRKKNINISNNSIITIFGRVHDTAMVLINGILLSGPINYVHNIRDFGYWEATDGNLSVFSEYENATLDIIVENWGRVNYGEINLFNQQYKGLWEGNVTLNNQPILDWEIYPLEFKKRWTNNLSNWREPTFPYGPTLYKAELNIQNPFDTFVDMRDWHKGIIIVNGFVLSRYFRLGPQQTAYLPAPLLRNGTNEIIIFEHFNPAVRVYFSEDSIFGGYDSKFSRDYLDDMIDLNIDLDMETTSINTARNASHHLISENSFLLLFITLLSISLFKT